LIFQGVFAALGRVRTIFIRQYVLVPGLRLLVALVLVLADESVTFLTIGYVAVSVVGVLWYSGFAAPLLRSAVRRRVGRIELPARELLSFALPVLVTNAFWMVLLAASTISLGVLAATTDVAEFQAVQPPARLNYLVTSIFAILFIPTISRMYAKERFGDLRVAYMSTTYWLTVLTVPLLALTTIFSPVFVPTFFGDEYDASIEILALLSAGYFFHSTVGPNSTTLKVFRRLRITVVIDLLALVLGIALNVALVPVAGAEGAALAFLLAVIGRNVPYQWALRRIAGIKLLTPDYLRLQGTVAAVLALLAAIQFAFHPPLVVAVALSAASGLVVLRACRRLLDVERTFPELTRGPLGRLLAPLGLVPRR
ncbi:MAG: polysaccharide biosynthesis C-terminal domain-containing protein, partial [Actinomycetota bacterium]|nr:polysaccharide biosynthesis C-terminal domain-containing protein [Actinomycetota bacterium]